MENDNNNKQTRVGIGFTGALTIAFVVLKLCGVIKWSWIWVLAPLWIEAALVIVLVVIAVVITAKKEAAIMADLKKEDVKDGNGRANRA